MDLKKYKITDEPVYDDINNDYINNLKDKLYSDVQDNPKKQIKKLIKLIEKYPDVPAFKNYLMVAYKMTGDKERALKVIKIINEQHPDYFFGKISLAEHYLDKGEYEKVPEILGSIKDISEIYPEKDVFHISEIANFHHLVAKYYLEKDGDEDENYQNHYDTLISIHEELYGTSENKYTKSLDMFCLSKRMKAGYENLKKIQKNTVSVEADGYNQEIQTKDKPKFNHPETEDLYYLGFDIEPEFLKKILALPRELLIEDLETVLKDSICRYEFFCEKKENDEFYFEDSIFIYHALYLLAELKSPESLSLIIDLLRQGKRFLDFWFGYTLTEDIWKIIYALSEENLEELIEFVKEPRRSLFAKTTVFSVLTQIALNKPEKRQYIINIYKDFISFFLNNKNNPDIYDNELTGFLVMDIFDLKGKELLEDIKLLYDKDMVLESIPGPFEDVKKILIEGERYDRTLKPFTNIFEEYENIMNTWSYYQDEETNMNEDVYDDEDLYRIQKKMNPDSEDNYYDSCEQGTYIREEEKIGRNDPCPCGSGKKYKKCCMN